MNTLTTEEYKENTMKPGDCDYMYHTWAVDSVNEMTDTNMGTTDEAWALVMINSLQMLFIRYPNVQSSILLSSYRMIQLTISTKLPPRELKCYLLKSLLPKIH